MPSQDGFSSLSGEASKKQPCRISFTFGNQVQKGISYHFNEKGILILCAQPAPLKTRIKFQMRVPEMQALLKLEGDVVWSNIHGHADSTSPRGMGVKFFNLDTDQERLLVEAADHYSSGRSAYGCYFE